MGTSAAGVRATFHADAGKVRVLMVVSPICDACLEGASEVSEQIAKIDQGQTVPLYVLWVPRRHGRGKDVPAAATEYVPPHEALLSAFAFDQPR